MRMRTIPAKPVVPPDVLRGSIIEQINEQGYAAVHVSYRSVLPKALPRGYVVVGESNDGELLRVERTDA